MKALHHHPTILILRAIDPQKDEIMVMTAMTISLTEENHVLDTRSQRTWRNGNGNLVRMLMNDNPDMARRKMRRWRLTE
jgi:hypothetical protein